MPARPPVPGVLQAVALLTTGSSKHNVINKLHFAYTGGAPIVADLITFANRLVTIYQGLQADYSPSTTFQNVTVQDIATLTGNQATSTSATFVGTGVNDDMPASMAALINWRIARRYRGGKPKTFLGGFGSGILQNDESINASLTTAANAWATALLNTGAGNALNTYGALTVANLVNVSYFSGFTNYTKSSGREASRPTLRAAAVVDVITAGQVSSKIATQRRRLLAS